MSADKLYQLIQELPEEVRRQAIDYVSWLANRYGVPNSVPTASMLVEEPLKVADDRVKDDSAFWSMIDLIVWDEERLEANMGALIERLTQPSKKNIYQFQDALALKLHQLDTPAFWEVGGGSADGFLYVRCYVVARGEEYFDDVMSGVRPFPDPWQVVESLLHVPDEAYAAAFGGELTRIPVVSYESRSNEAAWGAYNPAA